MQNLIRIIRLERDQWNHMSEEAHRAAFGTNRTWLMQKSDYALLALDRKNSPIGYISVVEHDKDTAHWTFGGVFSQYKNSLESFRAFQAAIEYAGVFNKQILCTVENNNNAMLRFMNKVGFRICGLRNFQNTVLLEHILRVR